MIKHTRPAEYVISRIRFTHLGKEFTERGLLNWDPEKGIHIQAFLDQLTPPGNPFSSLGCVQIENREDARTVRIVGPGFGRAIVPNVFPHDLQACLDEGRLSIRPERIIFLNRLPAPFRGDESRKVWSGSAVFVTKRDLEFPDNLRTETTLNGQMVEAHQRGGLCFEEPDGFSVWGRKTNDNEFTLSWALPKAKASRSQALRWAKAARYALSIVFGQTLWILTASARRDASEITELRRRMEVRTLRYYLYPLPNFEFPNWRQFNRSTFILLTRFFVSGNPHAEICWSIFHRLAEASNQETWGARELLVGTTLEAALRTLDNHPFRPRDHTWKVIQSLASFRQNYLGAGWEKACDKVLQVRERLRHRNAHPDWITRPGGAMSKAELRQSIEDLTFLSAFYGYMILALAGAKPLKPEFPVVRFQK